MSFSKTLRQLLKERNLKQADLCRMTGIQTSLMSDYLGEKKSPTIGNAKLIADALDVSLDTLVGKNTTKHINEQESSVLNELYESAKELSSNEQLVLLDVAKSMKQRLER